MVVNDLKNYLTMRGMHVDGYTKCELVTVAWNYFFGHFVDAFESFLATPFVALEMRPSSYVHIKALGH